MLKHTRISDKEKKHREEPKGQQSPEPAVRQEKERRKTKYQINIVGLTKELESIWDDIPCESAVGAVFMQGLRPDKQRSELNFIQDELPDPNSQETC